MLDRILFRAGQAVALVARAMPALLHNGTLIGGAGLVAWGAAQIYEPAGCIVAGVLLIAAAIADRGP